MAQAAIASAGTTLSLVVVVKLATAAGRGPLARAANWVLGAPEEEDARDSG